jgi:hypothetical protein
MTKVLYIAGWGRSGSTLLDQTLGQTEGWFSCGELNFAWHNFSCGCGARVHECEFWAPVLQRTAGVDPRRRPERLVALQREHLGASPRELLAIRRSSGRPDAFSPQRLYADVLTDLYAEIVEATGARVIVDSSKIATDAYLIATLTEIELYVVHLVRDPRATAYSWARNKRKDPGLALDMGKLGPATSSAYWLRRNAVIEALLRPRLRDRYLRLRYEDFVADPRATVAELGALVGETVAHPPFVGERTVRLGPNHTVGGNPRRFSRGDIEIRPDDEWRSAMARVPRMLASLPAVPLARRYGYPLLAA